MHMTLRFLIPLALVATLIAGQAMAEGLSHAQARAAFDETVRTGQLATGEPGLPPEQAAPAEPSRPVDILAGDGLSLKLNEFYDERYGEGRAPSGRGPDWPQRRLLSRRF